ncbi:MAG: hypothetical protein V8S75_09560 [[Ruminococcus] torques]
MVQMMLNRVLQDGHRLTVVMSLRIPVKAKLDGEYVQKESLLFDIKCFLGTIGKVAKDDSVVEGGTGEMNKNDSVSSIENKKKILVVCQYYKPGKI